MANIPVAPFYVPRPAEDQLWSRGPISNRGIIDLCTTELKWFGAPGQVPTKRWNTFYTDNDAAVWNWQSQSSQRILDLCTTELKWYGAPGQVPTKRWNISYTYDDPAVWSGSPQTCDIIYLLAHQVALNLVFSSTQQYFNNLFYDYQIEVDTRPIATHRPLTLLGAGVALLGDRGLRFFQAGVDDAAPWPIEQINRNQSILTPTTVSNPFVPVTWRYNNDDSAIWQQLAQRSIALPFVPTIQNRWRLDPSDDQPWSLTIQHDLPLNTVTAASPLIPQRQRFDYDAGETFWQGVPIFSKTLMPLLKTGQVQSHQWLFGYDDPAYWAGKPLNVASPIPMLTIGGIIKAKQWQWHNDDPAMWSGWTNRNLANITTAFVAPSPFTPVFWRFHADDQAIWQQPAQRSVALPFVPTIVNHWRLDLSDDQLWTLTIQHNAALVAPTQSPFSNRQINFVVDEATWQWSSRRSLSLTAVPLTGRQQNLASDDPPPWQRLVFRSIALPTVPAINNRYHLDIPDDQPWTIWSHRNSVGMASVQAPPPPFTLRQPSFAWDDFPSWKWQPPNILIQLKWNINLERIANTTAENRIVKASFETRTAIAASEVHTAVTSVENRTAQTKPETRIATAPDEDNS